MALIPHWLHISSATMLPSFCPKQLLMNLLLAAHQALKKKQNEHNKHFMTNIEMSLPKRYHTYYYFYGLCSCDGWMLGTFRSHNIEQNYTKSARLRGVFSQKPMGAFALLQASP